MKKKKLIIGLNDAEVLEMWQKETCSIFPEDMHLVLCKATETKEHITDDSIVIVLYFYGDEGEEDPGNEIARLENEFKAKSFTNFFIITSERKRGYFIAALSRVCRIIQKK